MLHQEKSGNPVAERRALLFSDMALPNKSFYASLRKKNNSLLTRREKILSQLFCSIIWDRCYDFKNIFAKKMGENIGVFDSKQS
jgi:hypothetical protein